MTDAQINKAIAEACGWTEILSPTSPPEFRRRPTGVLGNLDRKQIPDYCNDLNAIHEAEKVLGNRLSAYGELLCEMTVVSERDFAECYIWHVTARQRAEAFLKTLGKWEEVQND